MPGPPKCQNIGPYTLNVGMLGHPFRHFGGPGVSLGVAN